MHPDSISEHSSRQPDFELNSLHRKPGSAQPIPAASSVAQSLQVKDQCHSFHSPSQGRIRKLTEQRSPSVTDGYRIGASITATVTTLSLSHPFRPRQVYCWHSLRSVQLKCTANDKQI